ncbi:hypothetical protein [Streptococcus sp. DTU_2020_1000888_1_SI_GRL_NUU_041A]|jgi:hypothetical protein|uniref:hypothetical protein n=1 Tax=Streptococcus sp. DTU_2020_1000888_1_SI_GRL_NUU_041A TaxID=3077723 RepID=UPI0028E1B359|nr:hypothetical protein [Streptococcus sp. DTU_2020_1000888_1_SI_GRL_NUU_041A]WNU96090.1 hypothetical protein RSK81_12680 [Streptococcus sp. DTU_2020_1000888_1_SI_GRL_NUU_041A]
MGALMTLSFQINAFMYGTKGLKILRFLAFAGIVASSVGALLAYSLHYYMMIAQYGFFMAAMAFSPYLFFGILTAIYQLIRGKKDRAAVAFAIGSLPSIVTTEFGITASLFFLMAYIIYQMEKKHRQHVVNVVAMFSKEYSPLYSHRLANKTKYKQYQAAYRLLDLIEVEDFELVKQVDTRYKDYRTNLPERTLTRTFKIKGIFGTTTVTDELYIAPQRKRWFPQRSVK